MYGASDRRRRAVRMLSNAVLANANRKAYPNNRTVRHDLDVTRECKCITIAA